MARFRTRARAVDMLGRQQIAGVPTAISELCKNAHDAYADYAIVDYYRSDRLFILRDDGIGMTEEDFEQRWLMLATESKVQAQGQSLVTGRPGYPRRAVLGEKGIGRLAVAAIGPQVLILSRPLRNEKLGDLLVSLIHWGLFEIPGADLEQVEIPTLTVPGGRMPGSDEINTLVDWIAENLDELRPGGDKQLTARIGAELKAFRGIDPDALAGKALALFDMFATLTLWLPANTEGKGYLVHPVGLTFQLSAAGISAGAGGGQTIKGLHVEQNTIEIPLFSFP